MFRLINATTSRGRCRGRPLCRAAVIALLALVANRAALRSATAQPTSVADSPALDINPATDWPQGPMVKSGEQSAASPPIGPDGSPADPESFIPPEGWRGTPAEVSPDEIGAPNWAGGYVDELGYHHRCIEWLGLRQYHTHDRNVGLGWPMVGTSWLNRPFYFGGEFGPIWMTRALEDSVSRDIDTFGGIFVGWDWDHYWGAELKFNRATPELINADAPNARRNDVLFHWSANAMYYPWGDSTIRPYWRWGIGNTEFDFPLDDGTHRDEWLFTFPIGIGVKYPVRRWLAARAELTDYLSIGHNGLPTQNNITLTFGLEMHLGVHPRSYWPWNPSRHIW